MLVGELTASDSDLIGKQKPATQATKQKQKQMQKQMRMRMRMQRQNPKGQRDSGKRKVKVVYGKEEKA